jgi:SAM-dependent methyltransferase
MDKDLILRKVSEHYTEKIKTYGRTPMGVDWKDESGQITRFDQLLKIIDVSEGFSINEVGCGYGVLLHYMTSLKYKSFSYYGYDLSKAMVENAKVFLKEHAVHFSDVEYNVLQIDDLGDIEKADFTIASGIFNVKKDIDDKSWLDYILYSITLMFEKSNKGCAFNLVTNYVDKEKKDELYYADPCFFFDFCKKKFSRNVALLHDYNLFDFTILIRKY